MSQPLSDQLASGIMGGMEMPAPEAPTEGIVSKIDMLKPEELSSFAKAAALKLGEEEAMSVFDSIMSAGSEEVMP